VETFYPKTLSASPSRDKYTIIRESFDDSKKTIIYFAGLFQKANIEYKHFPNELAEFNHIYVNVNFTKDDVYEHTVRNIVETLTENGDLDIECIVGFSFGGSMAMQFRDAYDKGTKCILISPGGFLSKTTTEKFIQTVGSYLYPFYLNDKWYMIHNYPLYQNSHTLCENDYLICSSGDTVHNPSLVDKHKNTITLPNISHMKMISAVYDQQLLPHILNDTYVVEKRRRKSTKSGIVRFIFGAHFNTQIFLGCGLSLSALVQLLRDDVSYAQLFYGFIYAGWIWSTIEYIFHAFILHILLYSHHKAHHTYPNKRSTIHVPMIANAGTMLISWLTNYLITGSMVASYEYKMWLLWIPWYYLLFEFTHLWSHEYRGTNPVIKNAKYYHKLHHVDDKTNYGFVTPFWDYVFGTISPSYEISFAELMLGPFPFYAFALHSN
jgi:sterol desaturase/sphingolipid hydroxylase (fatty acid hydroxylase superfamily)